MRDRIVASAPAQQLRIPSINALDSSDQRRLDEREGSHEEHQEGDGLERAPGAAGPQIVSEQSDTDDDADERVDENDGRLGGDDRAGVVGVLGQVHRRQAKKRQPVRLRVCEDGDPVLGKVIADGFDERRSEGESDGAGRAEEGRSPPARSPQCQRATAMAMAPPHAAVVTPHSHEAGGAVPERGSAKTRKPASPAPAASAPRYSREPTLKRNQTARTNTKNSSSRVRTGWTSES